MNTSTGLQKNYAQLGGSYNTQNNSHINNYFSGTAKSPPLQPTSSVPFPRDRNFVDREALHEVDAIIKAGRSCALVGLGGVGKSQIAIEYSYRVRESFSDTWVFWIHASSAARFDGDVQRLTTRLKIIPSNDGISNPFLIFHNWLSDEQNGNWL
ncbi:hypothetical protein B9Z65_1443 [Elsinoe australis]|uniref:NB-ARC domain-containing protein n=1 Tax=Elsinoe australis TaxID=40998 RepID=A0A2P7YFW4_9PEZI|nr:hypothetical protein B9Z65_1443 [Elsinoe australis]